MPVHRFKSSRAPKVVAITTGGERVLYQRIEDADSAAATSHLYKKPKASGSLWSFVSTDSSNHTASNVEGPGRILGNLLETAGRYVEKNIGRVAYKTGLHPIAKAEQRLRQWNNITPIMFRDFSVEDANHILRCAASRYPPVQIAAFRTSINFFICCSVWRHWGTPVLRALEFHDLSIQAGKLRSFMQERFHYDPDVSGARWKRSNASYDGEWHLYYDAAVFLWGLDDIDTWVDQQVALLQSSNSASIWCSGSAHERLLLFIILSWICRDEDKPVIITWQLSKYSLPVLDIVIGQVELGPACQDREGVDALVGTVISQMPKHFESVDTPRGWATMDRFYELVTQLRRWAALFQGAYKQLERDAHEICTSSLNAIAGPSVFESHPGLLSRYSPKAMTKYFIKRDAKWFIRPWSMADEEMQITHEELIF